MKRITSNELRRAIFMMTVGVASIFGMAQNADIKVEYTYSYDTWVGTHTDDHYILLANDSLSMFYSPMTQVVDSMLSTPEGTEHFNSMVNAANNAGHAPDLLPDGRIFVSKHFKSDSQKAYDDYAGEKYYHFEPLNTMEWNVKEESKEILGYQCFLAETKYHGRDWKVWFTPEIPLADGPWKFNGLPGLILEADSENGAHNFLATGIEAKPTPFRKKMYGWDDVEEKDRKKALMERWKFYLNPWGGMTAEFGSSSSGRPEEELPEGFDLIETDYK